jgi:predicted transcriptional regulator
MTRQAAYEQLLMVKVPTTLKRRLARAAAARHTDMSKLTREAIEEHLSWIERQGRADAMIERMTGSGTSGMTTDEIMALTRGDD